MPAPESDEGLPAHTNRSQSCHPNSFDESEFHESPYSVLNNVKRRLDDIIRETGENMEDSSEAANAKYSEIQAFTFSEVAASCQSEYQASGSIHLLERAIVFQREALSVMAKGHNMEVMLLGTLGGLLNQRYERLGKLADLNEAIEYFSQALLLFPESHPFRFNCLNDLGLSFWHRFDQLGEQADLDQAIDCQTQVIQLVPEDHPNMSAFLGNLGNSWLRQFELHGNLVDLNQATTYYTRAMQLAPDGYAHKPALLNNIGALMLDRYQQSGDVIDLDKAIEYGSQAIELTPDGHEPSCLSSLGNAIFSRFERMGELVDIEKAIEYQEQAFQLTSEGDSQRPARLGALGCSRLRRFERVGDLEDLDMAIEYQMQAVQLTPKDHKSMPGDLNSLALSFRWRFERLNDLSDVNNAIKYGEQAVILTPDGHTGKPAILLNLGSSWSSQFERLQRPADADKAIEYQAQALRLIPDDHTNKQVYLNSLGHSWSRRFRIFGEPLDLEKAIEYQTQAVQVTPKDHPDRPRNLNNLGNSFFYRYKRSDNLDDLNKAIDYLSEAVQLTPEGHRYRPDYLLNFGNAWMLRFVLLGQRADLESAQASFRNGAELIVTNPEVQIQCARRWAACSVELGFSPLEAYQRSFPLIPRLVWVGTTIQSRYAILVKISKLASDAVTWAIEFDHYDLALEWLEEGRSIVWSQILQLRTPFDNLAAVDAGLANRLKRVAFELEGAGSRTITGSDTSIWSQWDSEHQAHHHRRLAAQWDQLIAEARQLNGLHNFLQPRTAQELKKAVSKGPLVIINTHSSRCDALIIFPGHQEVMHVALNEFTEAKAIECRTQMIPLVGHRGDGNEARGVKRYDKHAISNDQLLPLKILWSDVVGPVLDALAITRKRPHHELPHITWCATGAMSFLPLHAAGLYDGTSPNAFDLVISSYTPTLSALLAHTAHANQPCAGVLAVGQANSPDFPPLPKTVEELAIIKKHASATPFEQLDGPLATVDATLNAMENHSWVHLACHATQNRADPSQSAFYLHDGELTLATITKRAFKNKGLAFLSACQTATGDDELPDEATHLAAGMLIAGYPSVIATMWPIKDEDAPEIAEEVYGELMQNGKMDHTNAAMALHKAVGKLREKVRLDSVGRWAPFVHIGA